MQREAAHSALDGVPETSASRTKRTDPARWNSNAHSDLQGVPISSTPTPATPVQPVTTTSPFMTAEAHQTNVNRSLCSPPLFPNLDSCDSQSTSNYAYLLTDTLHTTVDVVHQLMHYECGTLDPIEFYT